MKNFRITRKDKKEDEKYLGLAEFYGRICAVILWRIGEYSKWGLVYWEEEMLRVRIENGERDGFSCRVDRLALAKLMRLKKSGRRANASGYLEPQAVRFIRAQPEPPPVPDHIAQACEETSVRLKARWGWGEMLPLSIKVGDVLVKPDGQPRRVVEVSYPNATLEVFTRDGKRGGCYGYNLIRNQQKLTVEVQS